jgi:protein tyrosine phosphatase (PTP) superfamily phosphohydrolase (DUF442 family)
MAEVAPGLFRGAQPEGDASFAHLAGLGVRTIVSVDGARPDAEGAARHGIRYVHLPMEYSGIPREEQVRIARVARDAEGGIFLHCHHGKHRGPAASAIAWMARDGCSPEAAIADMRAAGTDPRYEGLYDDVREFRPVTDEELAAVRPEDLGPAAKVPDFIEAMVRIDATFERMKAVRKAGWRTPASMPDVRPAHEARILAEHLREAARLDEARGRPDDFRGWLSDAERSAWDLETALREGGGGADAAAAALDRVSASCGACHDVYRNRRR